MTNNNGKSILILGKPSSSKTVFLAQLIAIANKQNSKVSFWKKPDIDAHLRAAIERIRNGQNPEPTQADSSFKVDLPIKFNEENHEILCPDYGGEQINDIVKFKELTAEWQTLVEKSNHWILFIRLNSIEKNFDVTTKSPKEMSKNPSGARVDYRISDEAVFIELLQILNYAKLASSQDTDSPKIVIALTCYDELNVKKMTPSEVFEDSLPLFSQFLFCNWKPERVRIIGVSALGLDLSNKENAKKYVDEGHDKFPFVVAQDSQEKVYDLTQVIHETLS